MTYTTDQERVSLPLNLVNDLLALCTPEDHELRERVKQAARRAQAVNGKGWGTSGTSMIDGHAISAPVPQIDPVHGDCLPPIGSRVFIRHGRDYDAHACIVTGYYAWGDLKGSKHLHRVFVRLVYEGTDTKQARMLCDCYATAEDALAAAPQPPDAAPVVPQFSKVAKKKLDYLLEAGEEITGYAIQNKDGRRGAIDCHGFVYWWQDAAPVQMPLHAAEMVCRDPVGFLKFNEAAMQHTRVDGVQKLYTEHQVRQLLAQHGVK